MKRLMFIILSALLFSCNCNDKILENIDNIKQNKLAIPLTKLSCLERSCTKDSVCLENYRTKLIFYISETQCQSCFFSQLVKFEKENRHRLKKKGVAVVCIFDVSGKNSAFIDDIVYDAGLNGIVLKDSCGAFLEANSQVPKEGEMYHSFVVDEKNNVLMVGSPFYNERMKKLFESILTTRE